MYYIFGYDSEQGTYHFVGDQNGYQYYSDVEKYLENDLSFEDTTTYSEFDIINHIETRTPHVYVEWDTDNCYNLDEEYSHNEMLKQYE